jgi:GNAT superfamily N-acetyltransferase
MNIALLAEFPDAIHTVARWHWNEWGNLNPNGSFELTLAKTSMRVNQDRVPLAYIALKGEVPVGTASLVAYDMEGREDLSPWLAGVYVHPDYRNQGVASNLVTRVCEKARSLGFSELYLYTNTAFKLYSKLGWIESGEEHYRGRVVKIMRFDLGS